MACGPFSPSISFAMLTDIPGSLSAARSCLPDGRSARRLVPAVTGQPANSRQNLAECENQRGEGMP